MAYKPKTKMVPLDEVPAKYGKISTVKSRYPYDPYYIKWRGVTIAGKATDYEASDYDVKRGIVGHDYQGEYIYDLGDNGVITTYFGPQDNNNNKWDHFGKRELIR